MISSCVCADRLNVQLGEYWIPQASGSRLRALPEPRGETPGSVANSHRTKNQSVYRVPSGNGSRDSRRSLTSHVTSKRAGVRGRSITFGHVSFFYGPKPRAVSNSSLISLYTAREVRLLTQRQTVKARGRPNESTVFLMVSSRWGLTGSTCLNNPQLDSRACVRDSFSLIDSTVHLLHSLIQGNAVRLPDITMQCWNHGKDKIMHPDGPS